MKKRIEKIVLLLFFSLVVLHCRFEAEGLTKPEDVGMSSSRLRQLDILIKDAVGRKEFPGAVVLVGRKSKTVFLKAYGESQWVPERRKMETKMIFDLASITKPVATATSIMILAEQGRVSLDEKVKDYVPGFSVYVDAEGKPAEDTRLWHLLTHTSGLPPYADASEVEKTYGRPCPTEQLVTYIAQLKKSDPPGKAFHYSCLGYITLAHILKKISGQSVAEFSREHIFEPLKMKHTFFVPPANLHSLCVPTQVVDGKPLQGIVHDPLARLQGGVSGNAGLFSTAEDLAVFAEMLLGKGEYRGSRILSPLAVERMTSIWPQAAFSGRGLGWDIDSGYSANGGDLFGPNSYGHTGYTGTSIWIDPDTKTYLVFLTNRVHPDDQGSIVALRSRVANVVAASIIDLEGNPIREK